MQWSDVKRLQATEITEAIQGALCHCVIMVLLERQLKEIVSQVGLQKCV